MSFLFLSIILDNFRIFNTQFWLAHTLSGKMYPYVCVCCQLTRFCCAFSSGHHIASFCLVPLSRTTWRSYGPCLTLCFQGNLALYQISCSISLFLSYKEVTPMQQKSRYFFYLFILSKYFPSFSAGRALTEFCISLWNRCRQLTNVRVCWEIPSIRICWEGWKQMSKLICHQKMNR